MVYALEERLPRRPRQRVADHCFAVQVRRFERTEAPQGARLRAPGRMGGTSCEGRPVWWFEAQEMSNRRRYVELVARVN